MLMAANFDFQLHDDEKAFDRAKKRIDRLLQGASLRRAGHFAGSNLHTSSPTARISSSALLLSTTPGRIR